MPFYTDQLGREIYLNQPPQRIVSLVPSQTELLFDLGLDEQVVGITKFCVHPDKWFRTKMRVGGTKTLQIDRIAALEPDLIIANKEENVREQVEQLCARWPVYTSDVNCLNDALEMIRSIGTITEKHCNADKIATGIEGAFSALKDKLSLNSLWRGESCLYPVHRDSS